MKKTTPKPLARPALEMPDPEETRISPETAFRRSDSHCFRGQPLHGYSFRRQTTAELFGLHYGNVPETSVHRREIEVTGASGTPEKVTVTNYDGMLFDIGLVLWLCSQPDDRIKDIRRAPAAFEDELDAWAEEHDLRLNAPDFAESYLLFMQIMADVEASRVAVAPQSGGEDASPKP